MTPDCPATHAPGPGERPTTAARLTIKCEPIGVNASTEEADPVAAVSRPGRRYLIGTLGILGSVAISSAAAIVILRTAPGLVAIALAELALGLAGAALIAACHRTPRAERAQANPGPPERPARRRQQVRLNRDSNGRRPQ